MKECIRKYLTSSDASKPLFTLRDIIIASIPHNEAIDIEMLRKRLCHIGADFTVDISDDDIEEILEELESEKLVDIIDDSRVWRNF